MVIDDDLRQTLEKQLELLAGAQPEAGNHKRGSRKADGADGLHRELAGRTTVNEKENLL